MNTVSKRCTTLILALLMLVMGIYVPFKKAEAAMLYYNTTDAFLSASVNSSGYLQAWMTVTGKSGKTTLIEADLYVEKRILGVFWKRVEIGYNNNVWHDSTTSYSYSNSFGYNLNSTGTYRVTVTYTVSGTGGPADVITLSEIVTY